MRDMLPAPSVVVGIDGSAAATQAALWAVDEAVSRDIPLRLVYVIDVADGRRDTEADHGHLAAARGALFAAQRTVERTGKPVKVETDVITGRPLGALAEESRSAAMLAIGSVGMKHACHGEGSVAAALPGLAHSPVAVIRRGLHQPVDAGSIVVEADDDVVLRHAFDEARLRGAPLRAIGLWRAEAPDDVGDANRLVQAQLNRRLAHWKRLYPDVAVEPIVVRGNVCRYLEGNGLAKNGESVQLFVTGVRRCDHGGPGPVECSVLTVRGNHL